MKSTLRKRLDAVGLFEQLNLNKNKELNDLITLATEICKVPLAMITLMDENIQWINCKVEVGIGSNSRENSFCKYLFEQDDLMVVPDASRDHRFDNGPAMIGEYAVRFFAGAPLKTNAGFHLGSLCVFDQKPHSFSGKQKEMFAIISKQVMRLVELEMSFKIIEQHTKELHYQKEKIDTSERKLRAFFNSSSFCHILISKDLDVVDFNRATAVFVKEMYSKVIQTGTYIMDYISPAYKEDFLRCLNRAFKGKRHSKEVLLDFEDKGLIWWNVSLEPVKDEQGDIISVVYNATNINEQKQRIAEITAKNESLLNIAYIQSHEYRRPVASILGLMELMKYDINLSGNECLAMLEVAVKELDEKIKSVVKCTEVMSTAQSA
jgi:PAS domain S-box-containing protein